MIIARAMMEGNLQAMDRRIGLMGELDRYHGFAAAQILVAPDGRRRRASPDRSAARSRRIPLGAKSKGNFPPRKPLKFLETRKKSRTRRSASLRRSAARSRRIRPGAKSKGNFPPRKPLKFLETRKEFRARRCWSAAPDPAESGPRREPRRSVAGFAPREVDENGVARKWRRNGLKRLNQRPEMVWPRKPRTYKMWYTGARPTISDTALAASHKKVGQLGSYEGKFSASQALEIPRNANGISAPTIPVCGRRLRGLFAARGAGGAAYGHSSSKRTFCAPSQSVLRPSG